MKTHRPSRFVAVLTALVSGLAPIFGRPRRVAVANTYEEAVKQHDRAITKLADAAFATAWLNLKKGSSDNHVALAGAADCPLGVLDPEAPAGKTAVAIGDRVTINLLGRGPTKKFVASEAIAIGEELFTAANGKVQNRPAGAGTYWYLGVAISAAGADGDLIEGNDCVPQKLVIA
ncbi:DUF2190 family protein [Verrucomicrobium spinosum]|uniref:DUF2190 family protein n=1 Tax=Verrucomicrobium spinosum TaxID=2736 RepID=UPI0004925974|nr:DUF2190 family protein [Verrucomicrobium spinosum]